LKEVPLSVVIITKNEASRIEDCLKSVAWAAEIIVVDDFSTDETVTLAKQFAAKVIVRKMDTEGRHRNFAYERATQPWILSLDADERIPVELAEEIRTLLAGSPDCNGYAIPRKNFLGSRWVRYGGMYPSAQLRLFKRGEFKYEDEAEVHPRAFMKDPRGNLKNPLLHYTYRHFTDAVAKLNRQTDLEAKKWFRENRKGGVIAMTRKAIDRFWRAYFKKEGKKDGVPGLFLAVLSGMYQFLSYVKYWEMKRPTFVVPSNFDSGPRSVGKPKDRETISAVIMTMNCESLVEGTLKSVAGWVDEIVIVDGYSTDRTVEICRRYTDKIVQNKWDRVRFCTERNLGTANATSDWCLHIDPDERATPAFRDALLNILRQRTAYNAFEFRKKNFFFGHWMRHGGWYHYSLHFFRRTKGHYDGMIHESLKVDGKIGRIEAPVEHYPFTSFSQFMDRHNWYSVKEADEEWEKHGRLEDKKVFYELKKKPFKRFFKFYVKKAGFLDGIYGFFFSVLYAWVHFLNWAKYWEIADAAEAKTTSDLS